MYKSILFLLAVLTYIVYITTAGCGSDPESGSTCETPIDGVSYSVDHYLTSGDPDICDSIDPFVDNEMIWSEEKRDRIEDTCQIKADNVSTDLCRVRSQMVCESDVTVKSTVEFVDKDQYIGSMTISVSGQFSCSWDMTLQL